MPAFSARRVYCLLFAAICACDDPDNPSGPPSGNGVSVDSTLRALPAWNTFAPAGPTVDSAPDPSRSVSNTIDTIPSVTTVDSQGNRQVRQNVVFACQSVPYTMAQNPRELVMFFPDVDVLWPGALIQGKSHKAKLGSLLALPIADRAPLIISIPSFTSLSDTNYRTVNPVNQATVSQAIQEMVANQTVRGLPQATATSFEAATYHSEEQFALKAGISGKYLTFKGSASGSFSRNSSETTVAVQFYQRMFDVAVVQPETPGDFFSAGFDSADLQAQIDLRRLGPDNVPVYVSQVTYGRMMMFTLTTTASEREIIAIVNASYNALIGGVKANLDARQKAIMQDARLAVAAYGGNPGAIDSMIRSGDWSSYFTADAPASTALPLSFVLRSLAGDIAAVTETTEYDITTCSETSALPGQFTFRPVTNIAPPVPVPFETELLDVTGDNVADLVWNHRSAQGNIIAVSPNDGTGALGPAIVTPHPATPAEGWGAYRLVHGDFNGDARLDLAWTYLGTESKAYVALSTGSGWSFGGVQQRPETGVWASYDGDTPGRYRTPLAGDTDGDGDDDLIIPVMAGNAATPGIFALYVSLSNGDGTFDMSHPGATNPTAGGHGYYLPYVGELNRDGRKDITWHSTYGSGNDTKSALFAPGGVTFTLPAGHTRLGSWDAYQRFAGDFDGDGATDFYVADMQVSGSRNVYGLRAAGDGTWIPLAAQVLSAVPAPERYAVSVADVDGDGRDDMVLNARGGLTNRVQVARGLPDGTFDVAQIGQAHPVQTNWLGATLLLGEFTGDGRDDAVWVIPGSPTRLYIGISLP